METDIQDKVVRRWPQLREGRAILANAMAPVHRGSQLYAQH